MGDGSKIIYGTAAGQVQSFKVTVRASDGDGAPVDQDVTITVLENAAPPANVTIAVVGRPSRKPGTNLTLNATATDDNTADGDILSYAWSVTDATPISGGAAVVADIDLDPDTSGVQSSLEGQEAMFLVPANRPAGTTYTIQVAVTDLVNNSDTEAYTLTIVSNAIPTFNASISDLSFPAQLAIDTHDTQTLPEASGGTGTLEYSLTAVQVGSLGMLANNLPDGLAFDSTASSDTFLQLTGTPTAAAVGVYDMTYKVQDIVDDGVVLETATTIFQLTVTANQPPVFSQAAMDAVQDSYSEVGGTSITDLVLPEAMGGEGDGDLEYDLTAAIAANSTGLLDSKDLPQGLAFTASSRTLSGTPTTAAEGMYIMTYTADDTDSNSDTSDTATITFTLVVATDERPILTPTAAIIASGTKNQQLATTTLPEVSGGNGDWTDSLSGMYMPHGGSATAVTVDMTDGPTFGDISLSDNTVSGLTFNQRTPATMMTPAARATITGTPKVNGIFKLNYTVADGDNNEVPCTINRNPPATPPANCDTAIVPVTLTVVFPAAAKIPGTEIANIPSLPRSTSGTTSTTTVDLYDYFSPQDGLTFTATSGNPKVLTVSETGGVLTLTATQAGGTSTVMVTASNDPDNPATNDPDNPAINDPNNPTTVSDSFMVTVTLTADPVFNKGNIETLSKGLTVADAVTVPLGEYFSDADGDALTYALLGADGEPLLDDDNAPLENNTYPQTMGGSDVLTAVLSGTNLILTGEAKTDPVKPDVSIKVRATDTGGNSVDATIAATVTNTEPTADGNIPGQKVVIGETTALLDLDLSLALNQDLTDYFSDAETSDANLRFSAISTAPDVVEAATVDPTSRILSLTVPKKKSDDSDVTDGETAVIIVTATDMSGKTATQAFIATVESRPAFAASAYSADLAEIEDGSSTALMLTELMVTGSSDAKTFELVSVNGQTSGDDYDNFAVAAKTGAEATTAVVTYKGAGEDYETLKAASTPNEPTFVLVISVTDDTNMLEATDTATLTVTVTDANEAPTFASQTPVSPRLLEGLARQRRRQTRPTPTTTRACWRP